MAFDASCSRLRLGGTISGSTLSGGTTIDAGGIAISTRSGLFGFPGYRGQNPSLLGSDGDYHRTDKPVRSKLVTINFRAYGRDATGVVTTSVGEHLEANMDDIAELVAGAGEQAILERTEDGTTRWLRVQPLTESVFTEGVFFNNHQGSYDMPVIMSAAYPFWQSETEYTNALGVGADTIPNLGNARISNLRATFIGAGTLTNDDNSDVIEVNAACTVDVGTRQIHNSGTPVPGRLEPPNRDYWFRLGAGTTNVTTTVAVNVYTRDHWL